MKSVTAEGGRNHSPGKEINKRLDVLACGAAVCGRTVNEVLVKQMAKTITINKEIINFSDCYDFEKVFTYMHLWESYKKCKKGVNWKASTHKFTANAPLYIFRLYVALMTGKFKSPGFYEFDIFERGKRRHIKSVRIEERIVQRCLCDYCIVPVLSRSFIYDNGATLKNKGYDFAINRVHVHLQQHIREHGAKGYVLLFDFSKFFDNISHEEIKSVLREKFRDQRILKLIFHFIDAFGDIGLGLGSQISQVLALAAGNKLDHFIKEQLRVKHYVRYMDDGWLLHESKEFLQQCLERIKEKCKEYGLVLNERKTHIVKLERGFTFLKVKYFVTETGKIIRKISAESVTRERRKLKKLKNRLDCNLLTFMDAAQSYKSWDGHASRFDSHKTRQSMDNLFTDLFLRSDQQNEVL